MLFIRKKPSSTGVREPVERGRATVLIVPSGPEAQAPEPAVATDGLVPLPRAVDASNPKYFEVDLLGSWCKP